MDEIMTVKEVAEYLRIHPSSMYKMLKKGEIPSFKVGTDHRFLRPAIEAWMKAKMEAAK